MGERGERLPTWVPNGATFYAADALSGAKAEGAAAFKAQGGPCDGWMIGAMPGGTVWITERPGDVPLAMMVPLRTEEQLKRAIERAPLTWLGLYLADESEGVAQWVSLRPWENA